MTRKRPQATSRRIGTCSLLFLSLGVMGAPAASAGSCTDGVDCYCDKVSDPQLLLCEDWESPDYYENTAKDWAATANGSTNRGDQSRWVSVYGVGAYGSLFRSSDGTPRIPPSCGYPECVGQREYCSTAQGNLVDNRGADCWGPGVNSDALIDVQRPGDYKAEISSLQLTGGHGATADVGDGRQHMAFRVPAGKTSSIFGAPRFKEVTEVGITMALAYSSNAGSTGILKAPWKHDEWFGSTSGTGYWEHWNLGITGTVGLSQFPYSPFMFTTSETACNAALSRASILVGSADCTQVALRMGASPDVYVQSRDFPFGTWGCHQAYISGLNSSKMTIKIWHNGKLLLHITNFDAASALRNKGYSGFLWNSYANANQGQGATPSTATTFRYVDNIQVRNGPPVSCSAIGFDGAATPIDPNPQPGDLQAPVLLP